jgi:hypothetical protein
VDKSGEARCQTNRFVFPIEDGVQRKIDMGEEVPPDRTASILLGQSLEDGKNWFPECIGKSFISAKIHQPFFEKDKVCGKCYSKDTEVEGTARVEME